MAFERNGKKPFAKNGSKKGEKTGGRKRGTPNKRTLSVIEKAKTLKIDPFEILLYFANGDWDKLGYDSPTKTMSAGLGQTFEVDTIEPELRVQAAKEAAQYLYPKRKSIEMNDSEGKSILSTLAEIYKKSYDDNKK